MAKAAAKSPPPPANALIVLAGDELFSRAEQLVAIQQSIFGKEDPGMGLVRMDATSLGADAMAAILDGVRPPSMFPPKKLVVVAPADPLFKKAEEEDERRLGNRELLENYLAAPSDFATLVLVVTT